MARPDMTTDPAVHGDSNRDPISGAPGAHPVGVGVGTAVGGAAAARRPARWPARWARSPAR